MTVGKKYKIRPDGDDGWRTVTLCAGNTHFPDLSSNPKSWQLFLKAEPSDLKILDEYGIEIAIPSIIKHANTSYVVISRETSRFVNVFMITKKSSGPVTNC